MRYLNDNGSVAAIFLFVMLLIAVALFWIFGGAVIDPFVALQNGFTASGEPVSQASKDTVYNFTLLWQYGVPLVTLFVAGLWLVIVAIRERSSGL